MSLFEQIREAQRRHGITQVEFADLAGIRETYMSRIMSREPQLRVRTAGKIAAALQTLERRDAERS